MKRLMTGAQMKEIDRHAIEAVGIPSLVLMERAALSVVEEMEPELLRGDRIFVACGTGNNGADGAAVARMLFLKGYDVTVLTAGRKESRTEELKLQLAVDERIGISVMEAEDFIPGSYEVAVDALFGVGLSRNVEGPYRDVIEMICGMEPRLTVAVDIPSGIHSDTGRVMGRAVKADLTVTFGFEKLGLALFPGRDYCGRVAVKDIGFPPCPEACLAGTRFITFDREDLRRVPARRANSNKGTYGRVLIAAGSPGMGGAAYLSALAAYRTGAGLVKILTPRENGQILQTLLPEAILSVYDREEAVEEPESFALQVERECGWADAVVLGPGLGREPWAVRLVQQILLSAFVPIVLDADGLNIVAENPSLSEYFTENVIVTPHVGEMARLTGMEMDEVKEHLVETAVSFSEKYGVITVLKDAATVVVRKDEPVYINKSGCPAMAKAGSGDVLTGVLAGLIAMGIEEGEAAPLGVYLHGLAGEAAAAEYGMHSVLAENLADCLMHASEPDRISREV